MRLAVHPWTVVMLSLVMMSMVLYGSLLSIAAV